MKKADVDKMCSYLTDALHRLATGSYGELARVRLDVSVVLEKLGGSPDSVIDQLPELSAKRLSGREPIEVKELKFVNNYSETVTIQVRNVGDRNPKAEIQIEAEIDRGAGRSKKFISLSVPSSHYIDFVMGILRRY